MGYIINKNNNISTQVNSLIISINKCSQYKKFLSNLPNLFYNTNNDNDIYMEDYNTWIENCKNGKKILILIEEKMMCINNMKQLKNCNFLFINENEIFIYNEFLYIQLFHKKFDSQISSICETGHENQNKLFLIITTEEGNLYKINLEKEKDINCETKYLNMKFEIILGFNDKFYIVSNNKGTFYINDSINKINEKKFNKDNLISETTFKIGKILNDRYAILLTNINYKGNIIIYDIIQKKIIFDKKVDFFFKLSQNCIKLIELRDDKNYKILICSYENSHINKKNGLFLFRIEFEKDKTIDKIKLDKNENFYFYDNDEYIIDCLLPLKYLKEDKKILNKERDNANDTIFFITSGSFLDKYNEEIIESRIYYLERINPKGYFKINFNGKEFNSKISCMIQLDIYGHLFISSSANKCLKEFEFNPNFDVL